MVRSEGLLSCSTIMRTSHWNATLLRITLSLGLGYLLGTYRIQIWSKLRNRLRTTTMLVHRRTKVSNYVSSCTGTNYYYSVYLKYLKMNTQEQQTFDYTEWNCTSGRPERLRSELSCHSLGFLLSLLCRAMLSAFAWASCCLLFIITSGTSESRLHKLSNTITIIILLSVAILPFLSLRDSLSPLLWNPYSWGSCISLTLRERSSIIHTCTSTVLWMNHEYAVSESAYARINPYMYVLASFFGKLRREC